jgi:transcriptional regulator with XRE-family HTH domain
LQNKAIFWQMGEMNRLKVVLVEQKRTGKWLAEALEKNESTVSRWCTNESQPSLETLFKIAEVLGVDVRELLVSTMK